MRDVQAGGAEVGWGRLWRRPGEWPYGAAMGNSSTPKANRRAAREAVHAGLAERARANAEDLAKFLTARDRAEGVAEALRKRLGAVQAQANARHERELLQQGTALQAMRDRGEDLAEIARLAGIDVKTVRELIKVAEQQQPEAAVDRASNGRKPL